MVTLGAVMQMACAQESPTEKRNSETNQSKDVESKIRDMDLNGDGKLTPNEIGDVKSPLLTPPTPAADPRAYEPGKEHLNKNSVQ
jgi:hypothetical protein